MKKLGAPPKAPEEKLVARSVRAPQALWDLFGAVADARGIERAEAMREAMRGWIAGGAPKDGEVVVRVDVLKKFGVTLQDIREMVDLLK